MFTLIFGILFSIGSAVMFALSFSDGAAQEIALARFVMPVFMCVGLLIIRQGYRELRRRNSLRIHGRDDREEYVWIEFDGSVQRSCKDPRAEWDAGGGDGDGGGGD